MISLPSLPHGTLSMWLSVAGLLIASLAAMVSILTSAGRMRKKLSLGSLAFAGFVVGLYAVVTAEQTQRKDASGRAAETRQLKGRLETADAVIDKLRSVQQTETQQLKGQLEAATAEIKELHGAQAEAQQLKAELEAANAETKELRGAHAKAQELKAQLEAADTVIKDLRKAQADQEPLIRYISASLGDLRLLSKLTSGRTYCVRIAAAGTQSGRAELEDMKQRIESQFPGAAASGMLAIIPFSHQYNTVQLVFGRGLSFAAAEVFLRLARTHHFANAIPSICAEPSAQDAKKSETQ
jgi:hypothetical protein